MSVLSKWTVIMMQMENVGWVGYRKHRASFRGATRDRTVLITIIKLVTLMITTIVTTTNVH